MVFLAGSQRFTERDNDIDLNDAEPFKWYLVGTTNANKPEGTSGQLGFVFTINVGRHGDTAYRIQLYFGWGSSHNFMRRIEAGAWSEWYQL